MSELDLDRKGKKMKPYRTPMRAFLALLAAFCVFCFGYYFVFTIVSGSITPFTAAVPLSVIAGVLLPPLLANMAQKYLGSRLYRFLRGAYSACLIVFCVTFTAFCIFLSQAGSRAPINEGQTAVFVYGCRVKGEAPGRMLRQRLDAALVLLHENPEAVAFVSGGLDTGETYTEGQVMAWYLYENGIDESRVYIDETATSTKGNIRAFLALLETSDMEEAAKISVSSDFHMPRIALLCQMADVESALFSAKTVPMATLFPSVVREYLAYIKLILLLPFGK